MWRLVADLLSEVIEVMGKDFELQFRRIWALFVDLIAAKPGNELRAAMFGLIGRVRFGPSNTVMSWHIHTQYLRYIHAVSVFTWLLHRVKHLQILAHLHLRCVP